MIFEAITFFTLLGIAFIFFFIKVPYREAFMFLSCAIFLILGFMLYSDYDVFFTTNENIITTEFNGTDITNTVTTSKNMTYNIYGNQAESYNVDTKILAWILIITGIITGLISFVMFIKTDNPISK